MSALSPVACSRCLADVLGEQFMVRDDVWAAAATAGDRLLCVGCAERSLGRRLGPDDFTDAPLNRWPAMTEGDRRRSHLLGLPGFVLADADVPRAWSPRLLDRLGLRARYAYWTDHPDRANPLPPAVSALVPGDGGVRLPAALAADAEAARRFAAAARSDATLRAYRSDWADFSGWCDDRGLAAMPATPDTVALYIASRAEAGPADADGRPTPPLKVATLSRRLAAISQAHKLAGLESPALRSREPLHSVWAGVVRALGVARRKVAPALAADVVAMAAVCDGAVRAAASAGEHAAPGAALRARRDKAMLLLGFAAALRRSELAAVRTEHVSYTPEGLRLLIPRSKSDQEGAGGVVGVAYGDRPATCPVRAVRSYVAAAGSALADQGRPSPLSGPVFRKVDRWGRLGSKALSGRAVAEVVKRTASAAGLDPALYAGHSLRAGFATTAARAGKPDRAIQKQTRHKSAAMLAEYVREGRLFDENASEGIGL